MSMIDVASGGGGFTSTQAREITDWIKVVVGGAWELITAAYVERAWAALGYPTWDAYCTAEFGASRLALPREDRREVVASLRESGLSTRAIGAVIGVDDKTVRNDLRSTADNSAVDDDQLIVGVNGKSYAPRAPLTAPEVVDRSSVALEHGEAGQIADEVNEAFGAALIDEDVTVVLDGNAESKRLPNIPTKPDLGGGISHPARYTSTLIPVFAEILGEHERAQVLDPFAGTGRIHELQEYGISTVGVELEPEWAALHDDTVLGDALNLPFEDCSFDAIVTSPTYGNRLADKHNASDPERRRSYTHDLGRALSDANSGGMQWGVEYREFHSAAWAEAWRVLEPHGLFVLNIKDHIRGGVRQYVAGWHVTELSRQGFTLLFHLEVEAPSLRAGTNGELRTGGEMVYVLERDDRLMGIRRDEIETQLAHLKAVGQ